MAHDRQSQVALPQTRQSMIPNGYITSRTLLVSVREEVESDESYVIQERWPDSEGPPMRTNENRARYDRSHLRYPSDLTDDEWKLVEPLIHQAGAAEINGQ